MQYSPNQSSYLYNQSNFDIDENTYFSSANKSLPPKIQILGAKNNYTSKISPSREYGPVSMKSRCKYGIE